MPKTHDYEYACRGAWDPEPRGNGRVRVIEETGQVSVLVITDLNGNTGASVTNRMDILEAELIAKHLPARFEVIGEEPAIVIEHYEPRRDPRRGAQGKPSYDRVTFESWSPRKMREGGRERLSLGDPDWRRMADVEVDRTWVRKQMTCRSVPGVRVGPDLFLPSVRPRSGPFSQFVANSFV